VQLKSSDRALRFLVLVLVAAGAALTPVLMHGQQTAAPAPATQAAAPAPAQPAAAEPAKKEQTEEEQTAAFRLEGPLVKATAKATGWSHETAASVFEVLNFLIVVLGLGIPIVKFMPKVFRKRSETVSASIEEARKATDEANARLGAIEAKLAGLDQEIAAIKTQAEADSAADEQRIKASIGEESARVVAGAEQEIAQAAAQASRQLRQFAADLAIEQAVGRLTLSAEADQALISEFIASAEKGGQN
jgi:F-type H+-transporting ATPase subunit b